MSTIHYTRLDESHLPAVAALHAGFTPRRADPALLHWQFFDAALPQAGVMVGAWDGDQLVGTQAFIPVDAELDGAPVLSAKSELTLAHPAYRGRGLFDGMYRLGFDLCASEGIACIWGYTNALKPFRALGFETVGPLYHEHIVLRPLRFVWARRFRPGALESTHLDLELAARQLSSRESPTGFAIRRTTRWLQYRYARNPYTAAIRIDAARGVLYSQDREHTHIVMISEVVDPQRLIDSVTDFAAEHVPRWRALYRFTDRPLGPRLIGARAVVVTRRSDTRLVWAWLGKYAGRPVPVFRVEEGSKQGV